MNFFDELAAYDKEVYDACSLELERQRHNIELIASENIVSKGVLLAAGTVLTADVSMSISSRTLRATAQRSCSAQIMPMFSRTAAHRRILPFSSRFFSLAIPLWDSILLTADTSLTARP